MKKHNDLPIQQVLKNVLRQSHLQEGYINSRVKHCWHSDIGKLVVHQTQDIWYKKHTVYIKLLSAPLKVELQIGKEGMIKAFNLALGERLVQDIVFL